MKKNGIVKTLISPNFICGISYGMIGGAVFFILSSLMIIKTNIKK